ncbi:hypothetical protein Tco_1096484 [Tanacetum coccineum]
MLMVLTWWQWRDGGGSDGGCDGSGEGDGDGGEMMVRRWVGGGGVVEAREGEWVWGSNRSGEEVAVVVGGGR